MRSRTEKLLPWMTPLLPVAAGALAVFAVQAYLASRQEALPLQNAGQLTMLIPLLFGVLPVSLLLGFWSRNAFRRCREQIEVRENALREFNASVEERVQEEAQKRHSKEKMLIQHSKMAAMDEMAALITQHLESPMERLGETLASGKSASVEAKQGLIALHFEGAEKIFGSMRHSLEDIGNAFRPDTGRETVELSSVLSQTLELLDKNLRAHGISIDIRFECAVSLPLYRNALIQLLLNVIQNAQEALVARRIDLPRIEIECYETGQFIVIRICDNAGGVDAAAADRIFEPFFSTNEGGKGAGLGLYLARNIVEEYFNGELTFDNLGEGACFYIKVGKHQQEEL